MIKAVILNLSMQGFCLKDIEKTTGLTVEQTKEMLSEISCSYYGGMEIFKIMDNATYIEKALMEAGNKLFKSLHQKEFEKCVSKGYPDGLALIFANGYMNGIIRAFAKGHSEWRGGWNVFNSGWVIGFAQGYTLGRFEAKETLCKIKQLDINGATILGVSDQQYEEIKDITVDDLRILYGISE